MAVTPRRPSPLAADSPRLRSLALVATAIGAVVASAAPALAQASIGLTVESDYRFRGRTLSAGRPTATAQFGYDDRSGLYLNAAAIGVAHRDGARLMGFQGNVGFAHRLTERISVDAGLVHSEYLDSYVAGRPAKYSEAYVGLGVGRVSARAYYSPHYFYPDFRTLYGEVDVAIPIGEQWRATGHVGGLTYLETPEYYYGSRADRYDWRIGGARQLGRLELSLALSGGGPGKQYYEGKQHNLTALTAAASLHF